MVRSAATPRVSKHGATIAVISSEAFQMFARIIDDFKESTGSALRLTSLAAAAALALFVTTCFICAAAFVLVLDKYGLVQACLAGAAIFFVVSLISAFSYIARKKQIEKQAKARAAEAAKSAMHTALADPMLLAAGLQVIRAVGIKRLIPILAVGGLALGFLASRNAAVGDEAPAE
jgi:fatty acid desaturase